MNWLVGWFESRLVGWLAFWLISCFCICFCFGLLGFCVCFGGFFLLDLFHTGIERRVRHGCTAQTDGRPAKATEGVAESVE